MTWHRPWTSLRTGPSEVFVLPLSGGSISVAVTTAAATDATEFTSTGRTSVSSAVTDFRYVGSRTGFGYHHTYTGPEHLTVGLTPVDELVEVRDHDVVLVPHGYHGPCIAAPGYPMYYPNVMAGPGEGRALAFCDDPDHAWIRDEWTAIGPGPRCPVTPAEGRHDARDPSSRGSHPR